MMIIPLLAAAAPMLVAPTITFTEDSVYTKENIIQIEPIAQEDSETTGIVDLYFTYASKPGYEVYDDPSTPYIDGITINGEYLTKGMYFKDFNCTQENVIKIKTVYSEDQAGMIMSAIHGDWSMMLRNPETILKLGYYTLATLSVLVGGASILRNKKFKIKTVEDIDSAMQHRMDAVQTTVVGMFTNMVDNIFTPTVLRIESKYDSIIKSIMLSKSKATEDTLALIDLISKATTEEDVIKLAESLKANIVADVQSKEQAVREAKEAVKALAESAVNEAKDSYDGTSI